MASRRRVTLLTVLVLVACDGATAPEPSPPRAAPPTPMVLVDQAPSPRGIAPGWTKLPPPPEVRTSAAMGWTGRELIVWGGYLYTGFGAEPLRDDGFAFDVATRRWRPIDPGPLGFRALPAAAWTGTELVVWGGWDNRGAHELGDGAAYDPARDSWRMLPDAPIDARAPLSVWTGKELVVWGTAVRKKVRPRDGAAYDPATDSWRTIAVAPIELTDATAVWTGTEMIVFGAALHGGNRAETDTAIGAAYDPRADEWRRIPDSGLSPQASTAAWNGRAVIAWDYRNQSAAYDPRTDEWTPLRGPPLDDYECSPQAVALGRRVLGDYCGAMVVHDGRRWRDLTMRRFLGWGFRIVPAGDVAFLMGSNVDTGGESMRSFRPL